MPHWTSERRNGCRWIFGSPYKITKALDVYLNVKNLTNTALKFTEGPGPNRVIQREF